MSYASRKEMGSNRTAAIIIVAVIHVALGYALISGLGYNVIKKAAEDLKTFNVDEPPPPPEKPPPPPPKDNTPPPPVTAPPAIVRMAPMQTPIIAAPPIPQPQAPIITPPAVSATAPRFAAPFEFRQSFERKDSGLASGCGNQRDDRAAWRRAGDDPGADRRWFCRRGGRLLLGRGTCRGGDQDRY